MNVRKNLRIFMNTLSANNYNNESDQNTIHKYLELFVPNDLFSKLNDYLFKMDYYLKFAFQLYLPKYYNTQKIINTIQMYTKYIQYIECVVVRYCLNVYCSFSILTPIYLMVFVYLPPSLKNKLQLIDQLC